MLKNLIYFLAGAGVSSFVFGFYFYDHLKRSDRQIFNRIAILRKMVRDQGINLRQGEIIQPVTHVPIEPSTTKEGI